MTNIISSNRSFNDVFTALDSFDPKKHLLTTDLKVVKKGTFSTWLGRLFSPHKYKASNVIHALSKYIEKNGRTGSAKVRQFNDDGELGSSYFIDKKVALRNSGGLSRFLGVLSSKRNKYNCVALAERLDKLLNIESKYLDVSASERSSLPKIDQLKGRVIEILIDKPSDIEQAKINLNQLLNKVIDTDLEATSPNKLQNLAIRTISEHYERECY